MRHALLGIVLSGLLTSTLFACNSKLGLVEADASPQEIEAPTSRPAEPIYPRLIEVLVVGEHGAALADFPVALRRRAERLGLQPTETIARARTDHLGRASLPLEQSDLMGAPGCFLTVELDGAFDPPVFSAIDVLRDRLVPVSLVAPPGLDLEVCLQAEDGEVLDIDWRVHLFAHSAEHVGLNKESLSQVAKDGRVLFRHALGVSASFAVAAAQLESEAVSRLQEVELECEPGESKAGRRRIVLTLPLDHDRGPVRRIARRLLDAEGRPLRNRPFRAEFWRCGGLFGPHCAYRRSGTTDDAGYARDMRYKFGPMLDRQKADRLRVFLEVEDQDGGRCDASFDISTDEDVHEYGDLRLSETPLLISGRLVDPKGEPVAGHRLMLTGTDGDRFPHTEIFDELLADTDIDGSFEFRLRGDRLGRSHSASVKTWGHAWPFPVSIVEARPGMKDVRVELSDRFLVSARRLRGRLRVPAAFRPSDYHVEFDSDETAWSVVRSVADDGSFSLWVPDGRRSATLVVTGPGLREPLRIEPIALLESGDTDLDPIRIEIGGLLVEVEIDAGGQAFVTGDRIRIPGAGPGGDDWFTAIARGGPTRVWLPGLPFEIEPIVSGRKRETFSITRSGQTISLAPGIPVTFRFAETMTLPDGYRFAVAFEDQGWNQEYSWKRMAGRLPPVTALAKPGEAVEILAPSAGENSYLIYLVSVIGNRRQFDRIYARQDSMSISIPTQGAEVPVSLPKEEIEAALLDMENDLRARRRLRR